MYRHLKFYQIGRPRDRGDISSCQSCSHQFALAFPDPQFSLFFRTKPPRKLRGRTCPNLRLCATKSKLLFDLPLLKILAPPVSELQHFLNCQIRLFKPASLSDTSFTSVSFTISLLPALPRVAVRSVVTFHPLHLCSTDTADSARCN